jgi:hypothetical protein
MLTRSTHTSGLPAEMYSIRSTKPFALPACPCRKVMSVLSVVSRAKLVRLAMCWAMKASHSALA